MQKQVTESAYSLNKCLVRRKELLWYVGFRILLYIFCKLLTPIIVCMIQVPNLPRDTGSEHCYFCNRWVYLMERMSAEGLFFHRECFKCELCLNTLRLGAYSYIPPWESDDERGHFYCRPHYYKVINSSRAEDEKLRKGEVNLEFFLLIFLTNLSSSDGTCVCFYLQTENENCLQNQPLTSPRKIPTIFMFPVFLFFSIPVYFTNPFIELPV